MAVRARECPLLALLLAEVCSLCVNGGRGYRYSQCMITHTEASQRALSCHCQFTAGNAVTIETFQKSKRLYNKLLVWVVTGWLEL